MADPEDLVRCWPFAGERPSAPVVAAALRPIARRAVDAEYVCVELDPALVFAGARQRRLRLDFLHLQAVLGGRRAA